MASIYSRRNQIWIKFALPGSGRVERLSLQTSDWGRAALIQRKVELQVELMDPALVGLEIPEKIRQMLPARARRGPSLAAEPPKTVPVEAETTASSPANQHRIEHVLAEYLAFIESENSPHHVKNKITHPIRFFGAARIGLPAERGAGVFTGQYLTDVAVGEIRQMIDALPVGKKTKRHYRETFHSLFEFSMKSSFFEPTFPFPGKASTDPTLKGGQTILLIIYKLPGANVIQTVDAITKALPGFAGQYSASH